MDFDVVGRQLLRALRGERSQTALSRRLSFATNVVYTWEAGRRSPPFTALWRVARKVGVPVGDVLARFLTVVPEGIGADGVETVEGSAAFLRDLRGDQPILLLARATGFSRHAIARWLSGRAEPTLGQALTFIEAATRRGLDLVACFVDPATLPEAAEAWRMLRARRAIALAFPWSQAVLRALELTGYRALPAHEPGWIARHLGIDPDEESRCLAALGDAGLIEQVGRRYVGVSVTVDTRPGADAARRAVKQHWAQVGVNRLEGGADGLFSYNVFGVSRADLARIEVLHAAYFNEFRAIVAASEPVECVAVANVQLFRLSSDEE